MICSYELDSVIYIIMHIYDMSYWTKNFGLREMLRGPYMYIQPPSSINGSISYLAQ